MLMHPFDSKNKRYNFISTIERFQVAFSNKNRQKLRYNYGREYGRNDKGWYLPEQKVQENLVVRLRQRLKKGKEDSK